MNSIIKSIKFQSLSKFVCVCVWILETYFLVDSMLLFFLNKCVLFFVGISLHYLCTHNSLIDSDETKGVILY